MRRTVGLIALLAALGASPCLAQTQPQNDVPNPQPAFRDDRGLLPPVSSPATEYAKGLAALKARRYGVAIRSLGRVTDAHPSNAAAWRLLGVAYAGNAHWTASRRAYKRALYLAPNDIISHAGLGAALVALHDPKAQKQAEWLKVRREACNDTCPEAPILKAIETRGPFAASSPS